MVKKELWLTKEARGHLEEIEQALPVKPLPSKIVEQALADYARKLKAPAHRD